MLVSPEYLTTIPDGSNVTGVYSPNKDITVTALLSPRNSTKGSFFVARHTDYRTLDTTHYTLRLPTSAGTITIPQLDNELTLKGRDSKIHLTDYKVGNYTLLYSTAEIFTWKKFDDKTVLVLYGSPGEIHEIAIKLWNRRQ